MPSSLHLRTIPTHLLPSLPGMSYPPPALSQSSPAEQPALSTRDRVEPRPIEVPLPLSTMQRARALEMTWRRTRLRRRCSSPNRFSRAALRTSGGAGRPAEASVSARVAVRRVPSTNQQTKTADPTAISRGLRPTEPHSLRSNATRTPTAMRSLPATCSSLSTPIPLLVRSRRCPHREMNSLRGRIPSATSPVPSVRGLQKMPSPPAP